MFKKRSVTYSIPKSTFQYIFIIIFTNFALFSIELKFLPINSFYLTFAFSILYISFLYKWNLFVNLLKYEILILSLITAYSIILLIFKGGDVSFVKNHFFILSFLGTSFFINLFCLKYNFDIIKVFQTVIFINVIFTILLFLSPQLNDIFSKIIDFKFHGSEASLIEDDTRGFALMSRGPYYDYPILIGFSIILTFERIKNSNYSYNKALPLLILSIIAIGINARIGFVPVVIYLTFQTISKLSFKRIMIFGILISLFIFLLSKGLIITNEKLEWVIEPFIWTYNLIFKNGAEIGHFRILFGGFFFFPERTSDLIFGSGINVFDAQYIPGIGYRNSDMGYIRQIFYGGITYLTLVAFFIYFLTKNLHHISNKIKGKYFLSSIFLLSIMLCNIKGNFFQGNSVIYALLLISTTIHYKSIYKK